MQVVLTVIGGQGVGSTVYCKFSIGNAVAIPPDGGTEIRWFCQVAAEGIKAKYDVALRTVPVRRQPFGNGCTVIGNGDLYPICVKSLFMYA